MYNVSSFDTKSRDGAYRASKKTRLRHFPGALEYKDEIYNVGKDILCDIIHQIKKGQKPSSLTSRHLLRHTRKSISFKFRKRTGAVVTFGCRAVLSAVFNKIIRCFEPFFFRYYIHQIAFYLFWIPFIGKSPQTRQSTHMRVYRDTVHDAVGIPEHDISSLSRHTR
jgi:hypothetical protein